MGRPNALRTLLVVLSLSAPTTADALDPETVRSMLEVREGATCVRRDELARAIPRWLEGERLASDLTIVVEGSRDDPHSVTVALIRQGSLLARREFRPGPADCAELHEALSLAIALALQAAVEPPRPAAPAAEPAEPLRSARADVDRRWSVRAGGLMTLGLVSALVAGPTLGAERRLGHGLALRVGTFGIVARDVPIEAARTPFALTLFGGRADACARRVLVRSLAGQGCVGMLGGGLHARGRGGSLAQRATLGWAALVASIGLRWTFSPRLSLDLEPGVLVPLRATRVGLRDTGGSVVAAEPLRAIAFALDAALGVHF